VEIKIDRYLKRGSNRVQPGGLAYFQTAGFLYGYKFEARSYLAEGKGVTLMARSTPCRNTSYCAFFPNLVFGDRGET
jgi:hypothetical protein